MRLKIPISIHSLYLSTSYRSTTLYDTTQYLINTQKSRDISSYYQICVLFVFVQKLLFILAIRVKTGGKYVLTTASGIASFDP